jgi:lipoteichoic acid synthase
MRKHNAIVLIFLICGGLQATVEKAAERPAVWLKQEIRYTCEGASEVFLVWGINNWQVPDSVSRPAGSYLKDGLLYTPMRKEEGLFSAELKVKQNTLIDYTFWITKGPRDFAADTWDGKKPGDSVSKQNARHSLCLENNIALVESALVAKPVNELTVLDFSGRMASVAILLLFTVLVIKRTRYKHMEIKPGPYIIIMGSAMILFTLLVLARASIMWMSWDMYFHPIANFPKLMWGGFYDFLYVSVLSLVFLLAVFVFKKHETVQYALSYSFVAIAFISLLVGILNIRMVELAGKPFNFHHLYYAGFLDQSAGRKDFVSTLTPEYIRDVIMFCIAAFALILLFVFLNALFFKKVKLSKLFFTLLISLSAGYMIVASKKVKTLSINYERLANPVTEVFFSINPFESDPQLFTMKVPDSLKKFPRQAESTLPERYSDLPKKIKNVIVVLMESVGAGYVEPYDSIYKATPKIAGCISNAIVFKNVYVHEPSSTASLVSLLGSVQPWLSNTSIIERYPALDIPTLSSELKKKSYRTGFFNSGNNASEGINGFLAHRDFELIKDNKRITCRQNVSIEKNDDICTEKELVSWLRIAPAMPFFAVVNMKQTTAPYHFRGEEKAYRTKDTLLTRYLNALSATDAVVGKLIDDLKHNRLLESTLIVLTSSRAEVFGRYGDNHPLAGIYEEQMHVPCIFINPLLKGETNYTTGSISDLAPTIMNILGYEAAPSWQGISLLANEREPRVYFFSGQNEYKFGYREGDRKYIYNAGSNSTEIYDLAIDPYETYNLAEEQPDVVDMFHRRLAAWVQHQRVYMDTKIKAVPLLASVQ